MWIDPRDPEHIVTGSDGGMAISHDRGETWQFVSTLPIGQFYHVAVDMDLPYHVYGGLQDNGSWRGPTSVWDPRRHPQLGLGRGRRRRRLRHPARSRGLDGAATRCRRGARSCAGTCAPGENRSIKPPQPATARSRSASTGTPAWRQDPFEPGTIYYGSQYVHKSTDRGASWTVISPDLTTNNPEWQQQEKSGGLTLDVSGRRELHHHPRHRPQRRCSRG